MSIWIFFFLLPRKLVIVYFTNNYSFIIQCHYLLKIIIIIDYDVYVLILFIYLSYLLNS